MNLRAWSVGSLWRIRRKAVSKGGISVGPGPGVASKGASLPDRAGLPRYQLVVSTSISSGSGRPMREQASRTIWRTSSSHARRCGGSERLALGKRSSTTGVTEAQVVAPSRA